MSGRSGIFAGDNPFEITRRWLAEAAEVELNDPNAMSLATVDNQGLPNLRVVLAKAIEDDAMVFYTNYNSRKGKEIISAGKAATNFHWKTLRRQIRMRGSVVKVSPQTSDEYYYSRDLGSRIGAWASHQSEVLDSKSDLVKAVAKAQLEHGAKPKRPSYWGGFRLVPVEIEFWADGKFRLHDRFRWTRADSAGEWQVCRLNP